MNDIENGLNLRLLGAPGDLGWVVMTHGEIYAREFGWDETFEALVAQIVADYANGHDSKREAAWIAELDGRRVGCVFCVADETDLSAAKLRILLVHPSARGRGVGGLLINACLDFARSAGYQLIRLWTNDPLVAARRLYLQRGFILLEETPHRSFGVDLIGQTYELNLQLDRDMDGDLDPITQAAPTRLMRSMIARVWNGWASPATADDYQQHYEAEVSEHLRHVPGFRGGRLLRRIDGESVMFTSLTFFESMDAVRAFAGDDYEQAVIEDAAQQALTRWDLTASHYNVAVEVEPRT